MKLNDRIRIRKRYAPPESRTGEGVLVALPVSENQGLVWLDEHVGHNAATKWSSMIDTVTPECCDIDALRKLWETREARFWFVIESDFEVLPPKFPESGHVPGLHHCSKGCGMTNNYADASAFKTGKYVCFQCSLWARKCEW